MFVLLSRTQAGPGRTVKQEQEEISRNHIQTFISPSVSPAMKNHSSVMPLLLSIVLIAAQAKRITFKPEIPQSSHWRKCGYGADFAARPKVGGSGTAGVNAYGAESNSHDFLCCDHCQLQDLDKCKLL